MKTSTTLSAKLQFAMLSLFVSTLTLMTSCTKEDGAQPSSSQANSDNEKTAIISVASQRMVFQSLIFEHFAGNTLNPEYKVIVFSNGKAIFEGKKNVNKRGNYELDINKEAMNSINNLAIQFLKKSQRMEMATENSAQRNAAVPLVITSFYKGEDSAPIKYTDFLTGSPAYLVIFRTQVEAAAGIPAYVTKTIGFPDGGEGK